jgi:hypothetical protein
MVIFSTVAHYGAGMAVLLIPALAPFFLLLKQPESEFEPVRETTPVEMSVGMFVVHILLWIYAAAICELALINKSLVHFVCTGIMLSLIAYLLFLSLRYLLGSPKSKKLDKFSEPPAQMNSVLKNVVVCTICLAFFGMGIALILT